jgi:hypothetical protein
MKDPDQDATSGNHHVINATYHLISKKLGGYEDPVNLARDLTKEDTFVTSCNSVTGWYNRHPDKATDPESQDDNIALMATSNIIYKDLPYSPANRIYNVGKPFWYFDNIGVPFTLSNWQGRFLGLPGVIKRGAGKPINWLNQLGYCAYILSDVYFHKDKTDVSGRILQWLANSVMKDESRLVNSCINIWEGNIKKVYSGQMGEVLGIYHGVDHPFSRAMEGRL